MKTQCFATVNRFGFPLISRVGSPFIACTDKRGAWQHDQHDGKGGGRFCQHHVPERVEAPQGGTDTEAPQIPLALTPA